MGVGLIAFIASSRTTLHDNIQKYTESKATMISLAYVESFRKTLPDPFLFSHLIYAFGEFNDDCDGIVIDNPERLHALAKLKKQNSELKVILGIGGYKKQGFSEMCADKKKRKEFVTQCKNIINEYKLDGIDLDWEFPGTTAGGHTASQNDAKNYGKLVKDLRKSLGKDKWISFYSNNSGKFIDFKLMVPFVDYVNVSGYNLAIPKEGQVPFHQSPLYPSSTCGRWSISKSIAHHIELGVPREKILLGIPLFGRGLSPFPTYVENKSLNKYSSECTLVWDDQAKVPYYKNSEGLLVLGFDTPRSVKEKCDFIRKNHLAGGFVWNYDAEDDSHPISRTLKAELLDK